METRVSAAGSCRLGFVLLLVTTTACGPLEAEPSSQPRKAQELQQMRTSNGLSLNGLSLNGLSLNGLSTAAFDTWFQQNPVLHDSVMTYVVRCAVPAGVSRTYTSSTTGQTWSWMGGLGLAPGWTSGTPATVAEQRIVSACLAAHVDKYELHISISVQGRSATGEAIPTPSWELEMYPEQEACFFGNLFNSEGVYAGNDGRPLNDRESTARACALSSRPPPATPPCAPLIRVEQDCGRFCTLDSSRRFYETCTYNGITYPAITTRLLRSDIYTCGDGVCQVSEKCGTGVAYDNCGADCGPCP